MASNFWLDQVANFQPTQGDINAANAIPPLLRAPAGQIDAPPAPVEMPMPLMVKPKVSPKNLSALQAYLPKAAPDDPGAMYAEQSTKALNDQQANLSSLNAYIDQIAAKPQGLNFTPLAAYVDSLTGSKLAPAAQATAPMSAEDKDKMLFGLRNQLAQGQEKFADDKLQALAQQNLMVRSQREAEERERHNRAAESNLANRLDSLGQRALISKDNQTSHAVDLALNDKQLNLYAPRIQGADRILGQLAGAREGKFVDTPQLLADVNAELSALLTGTGNAALGKQERTEYTSFKAKIAAITQNAASEPQGINSPKILNQIENQVRELQGTYKKNYNLRADRIKRTYANNPEATRQQAEKIDELKTQLGTDNERPELSSADAEAIAWARANPGHPKSAKILALHGGK